MSLQRVALLHFHADPGGVSTVIRHAVTGLLEHGVRVAVLVGHVPGSLPEEIAATIGVVPYLRYDAGPSDIAGEALLRQVREEAVRLLGGEPDLWHFHNHSLGKNTTFPVLAHQFAGKGVPLVLQIHDFAEDGRPVNYRRLVQGIDIDRMLYPGGDHQIG